MAARSQEALVKLEHFVEHTLSRIGEQQDATSQRTTRLRAQISYALNTKMLNPRDVIARVVTAYEEGHAPLDLVESFVRQILGWREYARGFYWARMPNYSLNNFFGHRRPLPAWFWTGNTRMRRLASCIGQSLQQAHAHHVQRRMVIGNFALLAGIDPLHLQHWNLGIYIDAVEWLELPDKLGLSQFADGGLLAKTPPISDASQIDRMGDHCGGCHYNKAQLTGAQACPFNALYWTFLFRHRQKLSALPRLRVPYKNLASWSPEQISAVTARADALLNNIEHL